MKKLLLLTVLAIGLSSCTDSEDCYSCRVATAVDFGAYPIINSIEKVSCDTYFDRWLNGRLARPNVISIMCEDLNTGEKVTYYPN